MPHRCPERGGERRHAGPGESPRRTWTNVRQRECASGIESSATDAGAAACGHPVGHGSPLKPKGLHQPLFGLPDRVRVELYVHFEAAPDQLLPEELVELKDPG